MDIQRIRLENRHVLCTLSFASFCDMKCRVQSRVAGERVCAAASGAEWTRDTGPFAVLPQTSRIYIQTRPASPCNRASLARPFRPKNPKQRHGSHRRGGASQAYRPGGVYAPRRVLAALPRTVSVALLFGASRGTLVKPSRQQPALARCLCFSRTSCGALHVTSETAMLQADAAYKAALAATAAPGRRRWIPRLRRCSRHHAPSVGPVSSNWVVRCGLVSIA